MVDSDTHGMNLPFRENKAREYLQLKSPGGIIYPSYPKCLKQTLFSTTKCCRQQSLLQENKLPFPN
jgi:hypothetical protein